MDEKSKYEELKVIIQGLQKAIEMYNTLNPAEKLVLTKQDNTKDVSDVFVCWYNGNCVGLFKKIDWSYVDWGFASGYDAGSIYVGVNSNYVGMKQTHFGPFDGNVWKPAGTKVIADNKTYLANCDMMGEMSFDDIRLIMYSEGKLNSYEIGKASSQEMIDVLSYAKNYYQLKQVDQKQRKR